MPIINKTSSDQPAPEPTSGIIKRPSQPNAPGDHNMATQGAGGHPPAAHKKPAKGLFMPVALVLLIAGGGFAAYAFMPEMGSGAGSAASRETTSLNVDRLMRITGLIDLVERKIEQNTVALERASDAGDGLIADTMRLALAQNLDDMEGYQDQYAEILAELHATYLDSQEDVMAVMQESLMEASEEASVGRAAAIEEVIGYLDDAPQEPAGKSHFLSLIKGE